MSKSKPDGGGYLNAREDYELTKFFVAEALTDVHHFGEKLYAVLGPQASDKFSWSRHRSADSWRSRYKNNHREFELKIKHYGAQRNGRSRVEKRVQVVPAPVSTPVPAAPVRITTPYPAAALAKVYCTLARTVHRTKVVSNDHAWAVYVRTGSVERTREVLEREAHAAMVDLSSTTIPDEEEGKCRRKASRPDPHHTHPPRPPRPPDETFSVDYVWIISTRVGSVERTKVLNEMVAAISNDKGNGGDERTAKRKSDVDSNDGSGAKRRVILPTLAYGEIGFKLVSKP
ncbi:hypothetical protein B0H19DRAFT_1236143 [Mycena capillaripes]|nr:hypothetical protein B0H19DRAFT_1236143 [Mycena capillaripes]